MRYWDCMAEYDAESTSWSIPSGVGGSVTNGQYLPAGTGRLLGLRTVVNRDAASSLTNHVQFKLSCASFVPNEIIVGSQGTGLQTAPALMGGDGSKLDWDVEQPVVAGKPINIQARDVTADTPVTNSVLLYGLFEIS